MITAAAVLGERCDVVVAASVAGLDDPVVEIDDASKTGLVEIAGDGRTTICVSPTL